MDLWLPYLDAHTQIYTQEEKIGRRKKEGRRGKVDEGKKKRSYCEMLKASFQ